MTNKREIIDGKLRCGKCKTWRLTTDFHKCRSNAVELHSACKLCMKAQQQARRASDPEYVERERLRAAEWYRNDKDRACEYRKANRPKAREQEARRRVANLERHNEKCRLRLVGALRRQLAGDIDRGRGASAVRNLGCTLHELIKHLESKFQPGMSWDNYGKAGGHIDHIQPLTSFDLTDPEQCRQACHFSNLQPLWARDNISKGARILPAPRRGDRLRIA